MRKVKKNLRYELHPRLKRRLVKLNIQLVPSPLWGKSLARLASKSPKWNEIWRKIRQFELQRTGNRCEVCGSELAGVCHEEWEYDDTKHIQRLIGFRVLCSLCNLIAHMGYASVKGLSNDAFQHFIEVSNLSREEALLVIDEAFRKWAERFQRVDWKQDLSWLRENAARYGCTPEHFEGLEEELARLEWREGYSAPEALSLNDVPLIGPVRARILKKLGIESLTQLASQDPKDLFLQVSEKGFKRALPPTQLSLAIHYARAVIERKAIVIGSMPILSSPPSDLYFLDLEYDPSLPFIFIIGVMDEEGNVKQWFIESKQEEGRALKEFVRESVGRTYLAYSGRTADFPVLIKCLSKHGMSTQVPFNFIDLFWEIIEPRKVEVQKIFLPLKIRTEKTVAEFFGFRQREDVYIKDGLQALIEYRKYLKTKSPQVKVQLLLYNEEDLKRAKLIYDKLKTLVFEASTDGR